MKIKNIHWIIAGVINLLTAFLHLIGGQMSLVDPLSKSNLELQVKTELLGVWHMVTVMLFMSSIVLLMFGLKPKEEISKAFISFIAYSYVLFSICFIAAGIFNAQFAPQWTLLLPIGILTIIGKRKMI